MPCLSFQSPLPLPICSNRSHKLCTCSPPQNPTLSRLHKPTLSLSRPLGPFPSVSPVSLGTWQWGNRLLYSYDPSQDLQLSRTLETALSLGINLIDTADSYGTGALNARAEQLLGQFLTNPPPDLIIASKFAPYPWRLTRQSIVNAAEQSANRLRRPVDIGQLHWSTRNYNPLQEQILWDGIADAKEQGYIREVGVSNYGPDQLRRIHSYLKNRRGIQLATAQVQVSLLARRHIESDFRRVARELGVGVIGYSPLCLGLLSGKYTAGAKRAPGVRRILFEAVLRGGGGVVQTLEQIAAARGVTPAMVAMAWCVSKDVVVITGARTEKHVEEAVAAGRLSLSEAEVTKLERIAHQAPRMIENAFQTS
eukprot:GFKZ01008529.1.p1 GENE.GFKZ01008529.1~~GFKZ01008529.1.p1  ORF type:complete len:366 (-),score=36.99 GFKZ01008529.1:802-1899(-)